MHFNEFNNCEYFMHNSTLTQSCAVDQHNFKSHLYSLCKTLYDLSPGTFWNFSLLQNVFLYFTYIFAKFKGPLTTTRTFTTVITATMSCVLIDCGCREFIRYLAGGCDMNYEQGTSGRVMLSFAFGSNCHLFNINTHLYESSSASSLCNSPTLKVRKHPCTFSWWVMLSLCLLSGTFSLCPITAGLTLIW